MRDFRLPPRCGSHLTSGMLHSVFLWLVSDVSGQPISFLFKRQAVPLVGQPVSSGCHVMSASNYRITPFTCPRRPKTLVIITILFSFYKLNLKIICIFHDSLCLSSQT